MNKIHRIAAFLLAFIMVLGSLSGCAGKSGDNSQTGATEPAKTEAAAGSSDRKEVVDIDFWGGWNGADLGVMQEIVEKFNQSQDGIHVTLSTFSWADMFSKLVTEYAADGSSCDVMGLHPFEIGQFAEMGLFDPAPVKEIKLDKNNYSDAVWSGTFYKDTQYAVPVDSHMHGLFYNKELLEKAGITKVPETGAELIDAAKKLTVDSNGKHPDDAGFDSDHIVQYGLGMGMNHHLMFQFQTLMCQQGEDPFSADMTEVKFDDEKAVKAMTWLQDLVFKYHVAPLGETAYVDDFINGTVAMAIGGSWDVPKIQTSGLDWGVALYPQVFEGQPAYWASAHMLVFPKSKKLDEKKAAASVEFTTWLSDNLQLWADAGYVPSSRQMESYVEQNEKTRVWLEAMQYVHYMPAHPKASQLFNQTAPSPFVTAYSSLILEDADPAKVVEQFKTDLNEILKNQ